MADSLPSFDALMLPALRVLDAGPLTLRQLTEALARQFQLSDEQLALRHESSGQPIFRGRVGWAVTYLKAAGLIASPQRGMAAITEEGKKLLQSPPPVVNVAFLRQHYQDFRDFLARSRGTTEDVQATANQPSTAPATPRERIEDAAQELRAALARELRERLSTVTPAAFERIVIRVLLALGYGGGEQSAAKALGGAGDEGVDGVIFDDPLGFEQIYIQAKRRADKVGRPEVQGFVGAVQGKKARKGVFITTGAFTDEARRYAENLTTPRIVLIDGDRLAALMIEHGVAVRSERCIEIKQLDEAFFAEDD